MVLDNAILAHHVWKNKLKAAIASKSVVDAETFARDDCCEIGQWLYGEGGSIYRKAPEFTALLERHKVFHLEAGKVAQQINGKNFVGASRMIESGTPFGTASLAVAEALVALKRVAP